MAVKKYKEPDTSEAIRKTSLREVKILKMINHPNIVKLKEAFRRKDKLHMVFEFVDFSLLELIEKNPSGLPKESVRNYIYQLLKALNYLHNMEVVHRDVKPENLLVTKDGMIKLCDFGFARFMANEGAPLSNYVATRWYRSPELLVAPNYGKKVDVWAVGCIMAELTDGEPLFPGDNLIEQIDCIQKVLGNLPNDLKSQMKEVAIHTHQARQVEGC